MPSERAWVDSWIPSLRERIQVVALREGPLGVEAGRRLPYAFEVLDYEGAEPRRRSINRYQTDVLIFDDFGEQRWIPRVVIECKLEAVTTHDALTYSAKASTHKHVHPYLRYGILLGNWGNASLPARLVRHGGQFDFMAAWARTEASNDEWQDLMEVLIEEVKASRRLQQMLTVRGSKSNERYSIVHRPLRFKRRS